MSIPSDLISAYRAALYDVDTREGSTFTLCIDHANAACDQMLRAHNVTSAALITAHNPRSRQTSDGENASAHCELYEAVGRMGKTAFPSCGCDPHRTWPPEPGLFILDVTENAARALAQRFDQYAFVWIEVGRPATLLFAL